MSILRNCVQTQKLISCVCSKRIEMSIKVKKNCKFGIFCMVISAVSFFGGCVSKDSITPNELRLAQCFNQETNTAKNCDEIDFEKLLQSKKEWRVSSYHFQGNSRALIREENLPALRFDKNQMSGTFGCNQFFGSYQIKENYFHPNNVGMTRKMCEPKVMEQEDILVQNFLNLPTKILVVRRSKRNG